MTISPKLSICVPVYNRAWQLDELLQSIIGQAPDNGRVEICISDNHSIDNIEEVVARHRNNFKHIKFNRNDKNLGADRNYLKSVAMASGDYCWLMGSDDKIVAGAIAKAIEHIENVKADILLCTHFDWMYGRLSPEINVLNVSKSCRDNVYNLHDDGEFFDYSNRAVNFSALFSYLSILIFKRTIWQEQAADKFIGSAYSHVAIFFAAINKGPLLVYSISDAMVYFRGLDDSFLQQKDWMRRVLLDVKGYCNLADIFDSQVKKNCTVNVLAKTIKRQAGLLRTMVFCSFSNEQAINDVLCYCLGCDHLMFYAKKIRFAQLIWRLKFANSGLRLLGKAYYYILKPIVTKVKWRKRFGSKQ